MDIIDKKKVFYIRWRIKYPKISGMGTEKKTRVPVFFMTERNSFNPDNPYRFGDT